MEVGQPHFHTRHSFAHQEFTQWLDKFQRILVGQREAELLQAADLVGQAQRLAPCLDSPHMGEMPASAPALEEAERRR